MAMGTLFRSLDPAFAEITKSSEPALRVHRRSALRAITASSLLGQTETTETIPEIGGKHTVPTLPRVPMAIPAPARRKRSNTDVQHAYPGESRPPQRRRRRARHISEQKVFHDQAADCSDRRNDPGSNGCCQRDQAKNLFYRWPGQSGEPTHAHLHHRQ